MKFWSRFWMNSPFLALFFSTNDPRNARGRKHIFHNDFDTKIRYFWTYMFLLQFWVQANFENVPGKKLNFPHGFPYHFGCILILLGLCPYLLQSRSKYFQWFFTNHFYEIIDLPWLGEFGLGLLLFWRSIAYWRARANVAVNELSDDATKRCVWTTSSLEACAAIMLLLL